MNHLVNETSPYLLQHVNNPVDWYPWGPEALDRAKKEDKPILVSIGYSACHWCHVMERESFEDEATAALMNQHFVNIKIDREERPDLDHIYMDAVQAMTGSGGWPLNVFLTPDGRPFYGGTYFPPQRAFNRPSWSEILQGVSTAFKERRQEINEQANNLTSHIVQSNAFGIHAPGEASATFSVSNIKDAAVNLMKQADTKWGGFGNAPKFPQTFSITYLLRYYYVNSIQQGIHTDDEQFNNSTLQQALLSLDRMIEGGIYDQVGGGFARYATDTEWLVPHFEKMLYDNALLLMALGEAYQLTKKERYMEVIDETMAFLERELFLPAGGFYSALDADSEGVEGKFYVWSYEEVQQLLGDDAGIFSEYYDITPGGNWEGHNIPRVLMAVEDFAQKKNEDVESIRKVLEKGRTTLLAVREKRIRPQLDDKILLGWNALVNAACSKAFCATGKESYRTLAIRNMEFMLEQFKGEKAGEFYHAWKNGKARFPAFLDDYAYLVQALIYLQEITGDMRWLEQARTITEFVLDHFSEDATGFFYYTREDQGDVIVRKKEVYDGAVPSGNAVMAYNLYRLSIFFDQAMWKERSIKMVGSLSNVIVKYPGSFGVWACLLMEITSGTNEIAVLGKEYDPVLKEVLANYFPHHILMSSNRASKWPLLNGKLLGDKTNIWLCQNYACRMPVETVAELRTLINSAKAAN